MIGGVVPAGGTKGNIGPSRRLDGGTGNGRTRTMKATDGKMTILALAEGLLLAGTATAEGPSTAASAETTLDTRGHAEHVLLREDFNGPGNVPDPAVWIVNLPESDWRVQGRSFFPSPLHHPQGPFPHLENGCCVIEHHLFNPYHLGTPKTTFLGGEIRTVRKFAPGAAYRFEARVRSNVCPDGLVSSFFTYGHDGTDSDEIDFEFLSSQRNNAPPESAGDPLLTNTWNDSREKPVSVIPKGLDLTTWNTFRIHWRPGKRVEWTWVNPDGDEILLRTETPPHIPDEPMALHFNFWAADATWPDACSAAFQPVQEAGRNAIHRYEIDHVEVRELADQP
jgi:hypothetical protein